MIPLSTADIMSLIFFAIVGMLLVKDRKNISFSYGVILRRWKKGKELLDKIANKRKRLLSVVGTVGVVVGIGSAILGLYFLGVCAFMPKLLGPLASRNGCFQLVLPPLPVVENYYPQQIVFKLPSFWYWFIPVFLIIFFHESMHGIFARLEKIPIKSYGLILLAVIPMGAFVEPDEKKLKRLKTLKKLKIYAAGSFGNFVLAGLVVIGIASVYLIYMFLTPSGVSIVNTTFNTPAYNASLSGIIYKINDTSVANSFDLAKFLSSAHPNDTALVHTTAGDYSIRLSSNPRNSSVAYLGIVGTDAYKYSVLSHDYVSESIMNAIYFWQGIAMGQFAAILFILSIGIGVVNMLPLKPFDGGLFFEEIFVKYLGSKNGKKLINVTSLIVVAMIVISFLRTILQFIV